MTETPVVAALALIVWPFVTIALFAGLGPVRGLIWATLVGYLFLPERVGFDFPLLPPYTKYSAITYSLLLAAALFWNRDMDEPPVVADRTFRRLIWALALVALGSTFLTYYTNRSPTVSGGAVLPGLGASDFLAMFVDVFVVLVLFLLGRRWLATPERHTRLLVAIMVLGVAYAFLALFEIRMSPQLNRWTYGFFPHSWTQHLRGDGFRPLVFLEHGLWLGFYLFTATVAGVALIGRLTGEKRLGAILCTLLIFGTLLVSRNLGAVMLAFMFVPLLFMVTSRMLARVVAVVAVVFLAYPVMRHHAPVDTFTDAIGSFAPERAQSLNYRLRNETDLLARANMKPVFGWGGWGRSFIFSERGNRISVTDGSWILIIGKQGWVGYLSFFGLLSASLIFLPRAVRRKPLPAPTAALALISAGNLVYLIPNATLTPVAWLIFGAMAGFVEKDVKTAEDPGRAEPAPREREVRYSRFGPETARG